MFLIDCLSFTLQMHPVHKLSGLQPVSAAMAHTTLNFRSPKANLKTRSVSIVGAVPIAAPGGLDGAALHQSVLGDKAAALDALSGKAEHAMEDRRSDRSRPRAKHRNPRESS